MFGDETSVILLIKFVCVRKLLKVFIHETVQKSLALQKTKASSRGDQYMPMMLVYTVSQKRFLQTLVVEDICIMHELCIPTVLNVVKFTDWMPLGS